MGHVNDAATVTADLDAAAGRGAEVAAVADYVALLKPGVLSLVVFTGVAGLVAAPVAVHPVIGFVAVLCIAIAAGAAGAINMWYDRDIDALMARTAARPIPAGRVPPSEALGLGVTLGVGSVLMMGLFVNAAAAGLLALSIAFYVFVYTLWLKRRTPQNIVIGGAAGAFPPMIGWAAATGDVGIEAAVLFLIVFLWTPPHFWALALFRSDDYARAGVPMLPVVAGAAATRRQIVAYSVALAASSLLPWALGFAGPIYGVAAVLLGARFLQLAHVVLRGADGDMAPARRLFGFSIWYLFVLFGALMVDALVRAMAG